jgi:tryptophan synthase alpha chain
MNRIAAQFSRLRAAGRQAFIPYLTAGDPDLETTAQQLGSLAESGADLI